MDTSKTKDPADILTILVATDCHLGYEEDDPNIGEDSFIAFEEILLMAVDHKVDMILLGGDLFHENCPSQKTMNKCMALLRKYTMGDNPIYLDFLSDGTEIFSHCINPVVNYMDENYNVGIPVFSIHGNHDDPSGQGQYSSLDTLSSAGLINYFGKWTDLTKINILPILLRKGKTYLALYGLSHIKDDRLCRLFLENKVVMPRPREHEGEWFNILVLHQNRADRGFKRFISQSMLPDFLDFVIWGHEHDCLITPESKDESGFYVSQPGSSVPTSLCEGEAKPKHVGLLKIHQREFKLTPLRLKTCRPFIWKSVDLSTVPTSAENRKVKSEEIQRFCLEQVEEMIEESKQLLTGHPKQPKLPLIRLRAEYSDETQLFNLIRFGQLFLNRVANPNLDVVKIKKLPSKRKTVNGMEDLKEDLEQLKQEYENEGKSFVDCFNEIVDSYFENNVNNKMLVLSVTGMSKAVENFVEKDNTNAINLICKHQFQETNDKLKKLDHVGEENILNEMLKLRDERDARIAEEKEKLDKLCKEKGVAGGAGAKVNDLIGQVVVGSDSDTVDDEMEVDELPVKQTKKDKKQDDLFSYLNSSSSSTVKESVGRGRGRGRGSRGGARGSSSTADKKKPSGGTRGRGAKKTNNSPTVSSSSTTSRSTRRNFGGSSSLQFAEMSDSD